MVEASSNTRGGTLWIKSDNPFDGAVLGSVNIPNTGGWNKSQIFVGYLDEALVRKHRGKDLYFVVTDEDDTGYQFDIEAFRFDQSQLYLQDLLLSTF